MAAKRLTISELIAERGDFCNVEDVPRVLPISRGSAYAGVKDGSIPAIRVGARWLVPTRKLAALAGLTVEETS